jgi:hypothetical protein
MQRGPMAMKWKSTITKKTQDEKIVICHKSVSDRGALAMICGRYEEPQPSVIARWKIVMVYAYYRIMDMHCW